MILKKPLISVVVLWIYLLNVFTSDTMLSTDAASISPTETHQPLNGIVPAESDSHQTALTTDAPESDNSVDQTDDNVFTHPKTKNNRSEKELESLLSSNISNTESSSHGQILKLMRVVCNFNSSSAHREGRYKFMIQNMSAALCTDLYYEHAVISEQTYDIKAVSQLDVFPLDGNMFIPSYVAINDFKVNFPKLRTFLTVTDSANVSFKIVADDPGRLKLFTKSCVHQARTWGFNGINIKWQNPPQLACLVHLMQSLRTAFDEEITLYNLPKLLLGVTLFGDISSLTDYEEVSNLNSYVDQVTLLAFNAAGYKLNRTRMVSPLYRPNVSLTRAEIVSINEQEMLANILSPNPTTVDYFDNNSRTDHIDYNAVPDTETNKSLHSLVQQDDVILAKEDKDSLDNSSAPLDVQSSRRDGHQIQSSEQGEKRSKRSQVTELEVNLHDSVIALVKHGVDKSKINVGITLIGQSYKLRYPRLNGIHSPSLGPGQEFHKSGQVYFFDMCGVKGDHVKTLSSEDDTPYWYINQTWVSYESLASIRQKVEYIMTNHLGGVMLLSQSEDDFTGLNCNSGPFPVSKMVYDMSNVGRGFGHYSYSFPWVEYCGSGTSSHTDMVIRSLAVFYMTLWSVV